MHTAIPNCPAAWLLKNNTYKKYTPQPETGHEGYGYKLWKQKRPHLAGVARMKKFTLCSGFFFLNFVT